MTKADAGETATVWSLLKAGALAATVAVVVNGILYYAGDALGAFPPDALAPRRGEPLTLGPIAALSIAGPLIGAALYGLLRRFTSGAWPVFLVITGLVVLFMAVPPFQIENVPGMQIAILEVMHVVTAAATVGFLARSR